MNYGKNLDPYLLRLKNKHENGIVIGTSRAAHSLNPELIDGIGYNFAFALGLSSFDTCYLNLIKSYCDVEGNTFNKKCNFIISVDPWVMSSFKGDSNEITNNTFISEMKYNPKVNLIFYVLKYLNLTPSKLLNFFLLSKTDKNAFTLTDNGRFSVAMGKFKALQREKERIQNTIDNYKNKPEFKNGFYSTKRHHILKKLILTLKKLGNVYLVRLPTSTKMFLLEQKINNNFSNKMWELSKLTDVVFIDMSNLNKKIITIDGNHVWDGQSTWLSKSLNDSMNAF